MRTTRPILATCLLSAIACTPGPTVGVRDQGPHAEASVASSPTSAATPTSAPAAYAKVPGVVIDHSPASSKAYVGSPSIAILPNGGYVASHDLFGPGPGSGTTHVFVSADRGKTWTPASTLEGQFWSTLFVRGDALYILGTSGEYGDVVIRKSQDGGKTWTSPRDSSTGILRSKGKFHCAPVPVIEHAGRLWRAMEEQTDPVRWPQNFRAFMLSAPVGADLLDAKSWTSSEPLPSDHTWMDGLFNGWLEGNAVETPGGHIVDILRVDSGARREMAAIVHISDDGTHTAFDPASGFVAFPGGSKKFTIRFDPTAKLYWSLSNYVPPESAGGSPFATRNTLALIASPDLKEWTVRCVVLHHPDREKHAFQYVDWLFDGDDLVVASRTAFEDGGDGADSYHNADFLTFHRIAGFRGLTMKDSVPVTGPPPVTFENSDFAVKGNGIEIATLDKQAKAFSNRDYVWEGVPSKFAGWRYTRTAGGETARVTVTAKRQATLYVATAPEQSGAALTDWSPVAGASFTYTDQKHTRVAVYRREVTGGQELDVAQGNWSGTMVLLAP
jgi:hypothetical protein